MLSPHIIELSDHNICVSNSDAVLGFEPGFANIAHPKPLFGEQAQQQSRLHPRQSFNQFWSQLNLDPLTNNNDHFRHQADLAYAHLNELATAHNIQNDVIFAVPSSYDRKQLAILLGLVKQCSFNAIGLVDLAVLKTAHLNLDKPALFIDVQLHQTTLTVLNNHNGLLSRKLVQQIPGAGLIALQDAWANMVTDEFIRQNRFDPQHDAETEQYVYNQLGSWLAEVSDKKELLLDINNKGAVHQAKLNLSIFEQRAQSVITRIAEEIQNLAIGEGSLILSKAMAALPGLSRFPNLITFEYDQTISNCLSNIEHITREPEAISLVTSLPLHSSSLQSKSSDNTAVSSAAPSHILVNEQAHSLPAGSIYLGALHENSNESDSLFIELNKLPHNTLITILNDDGEFILQHNPDLNLSLNDKIINEATNIHLGDSINLNNSTLNLKFIRVL